MEKTKMSVKKRQLIGKKAKKLRREKWILGNIYGKGVDSMAIMIEEPIFSETYHKVGETGLVELVIENETPRVVLIKDVQKDVVDDSVLHVDFYQVNLKEKITTIIPLEFVGEPELVKQGEALLLPIIEEVEVECLPEDIPSSIVVEVGGLADFDQVITIADLNVGKGVEVKTPKEEVVVKIDKAEIKEEEEQTPATQEGLAGVEEGSEETEEGEEPKPTPQAETKKEEK